MPNGKRKNYITRNTWNQIEKRNELRSNGAPSQEVHRLNKEISKQARLETISLKSSMKTQMTQTKKVSGGQSKIRNVSSPRNMPTWKLTWGARPNNWKSTDYCNIPRENHWKNDSETSVPDSSCIYEDNSADESIFRLEELEAALKAAKTNKQPGPDELQMELLTWLGASNRARLLDLINNWWTERKAPQDLFVARVVPIFKKMRNRRCSKLSSNFSTE